MGKQVEEETSGEREKERKEGRITSMSMSGRCSASSLSSSSSSSSSPVSRARASASASVSVPMKVNSSRRKQVRGGIKYVPAARQYRYDILVPKLQNAVKRAEDVTRTRTTTFAVAESHESGKEVEGQHDEGKVEPFDAKKFRRKLSSSDNYTRKALNDES